MKRLFPILLAITFTLTLNIFPEIINGQENLYRRDWYCCKCKKHFKTEYLPGTKRQDMGRKDDNLCPDCIKEMGGLEKGLADLKQRNRELNEQYQDLSAKYEDAKQKRYAALMNITGEQSAGWNVDGLNGSMGNFFTSLLSIASDFTGTGKAGKFLPVGEKWFAEGLTKTTLGIGVIQTATAPKDEQPSSAGKIDAITNYAGSLADFLTLDFCQSHMQKIVLKEMMDYMASQRAAGKTEAEILKNFDYSFYSMDRQLKNLPLTEAQFEKVVKGLEKAGLLADLWAFGRGIYNYLKDMIEFNFYSGAVVALWNKLRMIQDEILRNNELIACIQRTLDAGNGKIRSQYPVNNGLNTGYSHLSIATLLPFIYNEFQKDPRDEFEITVDEGKLNSAISRIGELMKLDYELMSILESKIFTSYIPWITNRWKELKPSRLIRLLERTKEPYRILLNKCKDILRIGSAIKEDLRFAVIIESRLNDGSNNLSGSPLSEYQDGGFYLIGNNDSTIVNTQNWSMTNNKKIPADKGRINLVFPANVEWSVDVYTADDKFYTNRSSYSKHGSYDIVPGNYSFKFNGIPIDNVPVERGKEIKLKVGILNMMSTGHWELYDESKKIYYTSGNKPVKKAFPIGKYIFTFEGKEYRMRLKEGTVLKFDLKKPFVKGL